MKVEIVLFGVCLLVSAAFSAEADHATPQHSKADIEGSDLHAEESCRFGIQIQPQAPLETDTPSKVTEGQLSTATAEQDASFHLDSRGGITNIQGAVPKDDLIETHEKLSDKFQDAIDKSHLAYSADNQYSLYSITPHQWAYEVLAPSTGDYQSRVEHRQEDGVVRGRYSLIQPDGSLRVVNYIAHPEDGFQATVQNQPNSAFNQHQYQAQQQLYNQAQRQRLSIFNSERFNTQINREQRQHQEYDFMPQTNQRQQQFTTTHDHTSIITPKQSSINQGHQFWQQPTLRSAQHPSAPHTQHLPNSAPVDLFLKDHPLPLPTQSTYRRTRPVSLDLRRGLAYCLPWHTSDNLSVLRTRLRKTPPLSPIYLVNE